MKSTQLSTSQHINLVEDDNDLTSPRRSHGNNNDVSMDSIAKHKIPKRLKKTFYCTFALLIVGIILSVVGVEESIRRENFYAGLTFYLLAFIVLIPGVYYTYQFCKAKRQKNEDLRRDIMDDIPEI